MSYIHWNVDPRIFASVEIFRWYGLSWAIGMMLGYQIMLKIYKREDLSLQDLDTLTIYVVLGHPRSALRTYSIL